MSRPDQDPRPERSEDSSPGEPRRDFLLQLGKMTFLSAAVVKLGVVPRAQSGTGGGTLPPLIDTLCGTKGPVQGVRSDSDCGKEKSNGDQDCGQPGPFEGSAWKDNDCTVDGGEGADSDCGKDTSLGWVWQDNDCAQGGQDQDCGKTNPLGEPHSDSGGS